MSYHVHVAACAAASHYEMRYIDPATGRRVRRSTGVHKSHDRRLAEKAAKAWQRSLRTGRPPVVINMRWLDFRLAYEHHVETSAEAKLSYVASALDRYEACCAPRRVTDITEESVLSFGADLASRYTRTTVAYYLRLLREMVVWGRQESIVLVSPPPEVWKRALAPANSLRPPSASRRGPSV